MSNYWNYHCKTCQVSTVHDIKNGDHILRSVAKVAPLIKAFYEAESDYVDVVIPGYRHSDFISFLMEHYDHELVLDGERGRIEPIIFKVASQ